MAEEDRCQYQSTNCENARARRDNGEFHRLCAYHRDKANETQRRWHNRHKHDASRPATAFPKTTTAFERRALARLMAAADRQTYRVARCLKQGRCLTQLEPPTIKTEPLDTSSEQLIKTEVASDEFDSDLSDQEIQVLTALVMEYNAKEETRTGGDAEFMAMLDACATDRERVEKRWQLQQGKASALNRVQLSVPGLTYVSYDSVNARSETVATVRVTGDSKEIVECVEVVSLPPNGVALRWKSKECAHVRGHLLTSLELAREAQVNELRARGNGTVVVEDVVLLADCEHASLRVAIEGSGDVFVTSQRNEMHLRSLYLSSVGIGTLQFMGPAQQTVRDLYLLELGVGGKLRVITGRIDTGFLRSTITGSGEIKVASSGGVHVDKIKTAIVGSGEVSYDGDGQCRVQRCTIVGSGKVEARGVQCKDGSVEAFGDADLTWNVSDTIEGTGWSTTTVRYVGDAPKVTKGKSVSLKVAPPVSAETEHVDQAAAPPSKEAAFKEIRAVYDSDLDELENLSGVRKAVWRVVQAFDDGKKGSVKAEKSTTKAPSESGDH